jgi:hypothetical protein
MDLGYVFGTDVPIHDRFLLGGSVPSAVWTTQFIPFLGLDPQSRAGNALQVAQAGLQAHIWDNITATIRGNVGNVFDAWPAGVRRSSYVGGAGFTLSTVLLPGPLAFTVASRGWRRVPVLELSFGATF